MNGAAVGAVGPDDAAAYGAPGAAVGVVGPECADASGAPGAPCGADGDDACGAPGAPCGADGDDDCGACGAPGACGRAACEPEPGVGGAYGFDCGSEPCNGVGRDGGTALRFGGGKVDRFPVG